MKHQYNIKGIERNINDRESVNIWIHELSIQLYNPVLFYKAWHEDWLTQPEGLKNLKYLIMF